MELYNTHVVYCNTDPTFQIGLESAGITQLTLLRFDSKGTGSLAALLQARGPLALA